MSKKYALKRIALVAISAMGFGLLSMVPARAAVSSITAVTLQEKTGGATDTSLVVVQAGSSTTRASAVTIYTNGSKVDLTDLELVVAATYDANGDTYFMLLSPDNVSAERESDKYSKPTLVRNFRRLLISFTILSAIASFCPCSSMVSKNVSACFKGTSHTS